MIKIEHLITENKISNLVDLTQKYINKKGYPLSYIYKDKNNWRSSKTTEELQSNVGLPISTEILYGKPNVNMPQDVKWEIADYGKNILDKIKDIKITKVPISDIEIIQKFVFTIPLQKNRSSNHFVPLFKFNGKYYLNDGNHYVASMFLNGQKYINTKVVEIK